MDRQFNGYPISYLKAYLRKIRQWSHIKTREHRITALRALTVANHRRLSADFRKAWGLIK